MTLTFGPAPLGSNPSGHFNFSLDGAPRHRILFESFPRRMRAFAGDRHVLDSTRGMLLHESNIKPVYYAPIEDFAEDLLVTSEHTTHCPFKGDASYWSLKVGERVIEDAVWHYPDPVAESPWLKGYAALFWDKADLWMQEDEPLHGYLRDPYHRVDVMDSSRRVKVRVKGALVAESDRPKLLFETGLPPRPYLLRADILPGVLERSETTTWCPYKGEATYWHVRTPAGLAEDAAWSYETPLPETGKAIGHLSFAGDDVETEVS